MNTPESPTLDAVLGLALQARHGELEPEAAGGLEALLAARPDLAAAVAEQNALLDAAGAARLKASPALVGRLQRELQTMVRAEARRSRSERRGGRDPWHALLDLLFGRERGARAPSLGTLLLGRSLALYLGIAVTVCVHLALRPEERPPTQPATAVREVLPRTGPSLAPATPEVDAPATRPR